MQLLWSSRSPFVRKVMIAAHEVGAASSLTLVPTVAREKAAALIEANPLGQLPVLIREDGVAIPNSSVICAYLDARFAPGTLFPTDESFRWGALNRQSLGDGMMDASLLRNVETFRTTAGPARDALAAALPHKVVSGLARIERDHASLAAAPFSIGHIAIGCALSYLDFRNPTLDWRQSHPHTADWMATFSLRPSVVANPLHD